MLVPPMYFRGSARPKGIPDLANVVARGLRQCRSRTKVDNKWSAVTSGKAIHMALTSKSGAAAGVKWENLTKRGVWRASI